MNVNSLKTSGNNVAANRQHPEFFHFNTALYITTIGTIENQPSFVPIVVIYSVVFCRPLGLPRKSLGLRSDNHIVPILGYLIIPTIYPN